MARKTVKNRWNIERRLEFIDFRLYWEGHVNRRDLTDLFGISIPQASADLSHYQAEAPRNMVYEKTRKTYVAGPKFRPVFFKPSAEQYLAQFRLLAAEILAPQETWISALPRFAVVPILRRPMEPEILRGLLDAIRTSKSLQIEYQSTSKPAPSERWVTPHAMGFDGYRWHVRAWCHSRKDFRDFVLTRILRILDQENHDVDPSKDLGWQREVVLRVGPHPALSEGARRGVELDYGMVDGVIEFRTRLCLSFYLQIQLGLDRAVTDQAHATSRVELLNRVEVAAAQAEAGGTCSPE